MGKERNGSKREGLDLRVSLLAAPLLLLSTHASAGIAQVDGAPGSDTVPKGLLTHVDQAPSAEMFLPDPAQSTAAAEREQPIPEITIPQLPGEGVKVSTSNTDGVNAIPLPPALQSGLTGLAALGMAGGLRRLRRAFRQLH